MQLTLRDVAKILRVSEKTVSRWVRDGGLPTCVVNDQHRFNPSEVLEWATAHDIAVPPELFSDGREQEGGGSTVVADAIEAGGIHYGLTGTDKETVLRQVVQRMPIPGGDGVREQFLQVLLAREEMASTGIGDGIAIPHVRNPVVFHVSDPLITLSFLDTPVDFGSVDGKPVHCLFTLVSPTVRAHLQLISQLAFVLHEPSCAAVVARHAEAGEILAVLRRVEARLRR